MTDLAFRIVSTDTPGAVRVEAPNPKEPGASIFVEMSNVERGAILGGTAHRITSRIDRGGLLKTNHRMTVEIMTAARVAAFPGEVMPPVQWWMLEHPTFPAAAMPEIPAGFKDESYHNDTCPSFTSDALRLAIFVDYADSDDREFPEAPRFSLYTMNEYGEMETESDTSLHTDDWSVILAAVDDKRRKQDPMTIARAAAEAAANAMALHIQQAVGDDTGDLAGLFFSGDRMTELVAMAEDLTRSEIAHLTAA